MDRPVGFFSRSFWRGTTVLQPALEAGTALGILLALVLLTVIGWMYLDQAARITEARAEIAVLQSQADRALLEICYLQSELARRTSTPNVLEHGRLAGFREPAQVATLDVPPLATPPESTSGESPPFAAGPSVQAEPEPPWWYAVLSWLEAVVGPSASR